MLIHEIARLAEMSKDGVRHYEELGLIASTPFKAGSRTYRDYDVSVLRTIEQIRQAQQLGLTLKEIGPLLETYGRSDLSDGETVEFLEDRLRVVRERILELRKAEDFIRSKIVKYTASKLLREDA